MCLPWALMRLSSSAVRVRIWQERRHKWTTRHHRSRRFSNAQHQGPFENRPALAAPFSSKFGL